MRYSGMFVNWQAEEINLQPIGMNVIRKEKQPNTRSFAYLTRMIWTADGRVPLLWIQP